MIKSTPIFNTSTLTIHGSGVQISIRISSKHNKAYRRNIIQMLNRAIYKEMNFMRGYYIHHEDSDRFNQNRDILRNWSLKQGIILELKKNEFGFLLREKRTRLGLTQKKMAEALGVQRTYLSQLEHSKKSPSLRLMIKIQKINEKNLCFKEKAFEPDPD